jgi:hypothetical protein
MTSLPEEGQTRRLQVCPWIWQCIWAFKLVRAFCGKKLKTTMRGRREGYRPDSMRQRAASSCIATSCIFPLLFAVNLIHQDVRHFLQVQFLLPVLPDSPLMYLEAKRPRDDGVSE